MSWRVVSRPKVRRDLKKAVAWYDSQRDGLGREFVAAVVAVFAGLAENPLLNARRSQDRRVRWRIPKRFSYRVVYQIREREHLVLVIAVQHCARHDRRWQRRLD